MLNAHEKIEIYISMYSCCDPRATINTYEIRWENFPVGRLVTYMDKISEKFSTFSPLFSFGCLNN